MKNRGPISKDDLGNFLMSCDIIITDAEKRIANGLKRSAAPVVPLIEKSNAFIIESKEIKSNKNQELEPIKNREIESREIASSESVISNSKDIVHKPNKIKKGEVDTNFVIYEAGDGPRSDDIPDPNSPYSDLHGLSNTWQMPGMDQMSTEEYYAAINKRILDMKNKRKVTEGSSNTMVDDYFTSLSKPRN